LAYPLGGHFHIPHGLSNSLVLPHVLRFNAQAAAPLYAQLLPAIGASGGIGDEAKTQQFIARIEALIADVNLPVTLREMEISENDLPMLAADAMLQQRLLVNNPRDVSEADALAIYQAAY
jgi:alcohol dehydrogenase